MDQFWILYKGPCCDLIYKCDLLRNHTTKMISQKYSDHMDGDCEEMLYNERIMKSVQTSSIKYQHCPLLYTARTVMVVLSR